MMMEKRSRTTRPRSSRRRRTWRREKGLGMGKSRRK
jgi:hypothetical protein